MRVSSITVVVAVTALVSGLGQAAIGIPAANPNLPGASDFFIHARQVSCVDNATNLPITALARSARCATAHVAAAHTNCVGPAAGLPIALSLALAQSDERTRTANLINRTSYLKARGTSAIKLAAGAGKAACVNPATNLSVAQLASSARAGVAAAAGGNGFLGAGAIFGLLGATASTVGGVAALATSGTTPVSP